MIAASFRGARGSRGGNDQGAGARG